jgi:hypothetical protein
VPVKRVRQLKVANSTLPSSRSSKREPESKNRPTIAILTANHVDLLGRAFCFEVGTKREKTGVRNKSNPAMKAHLLAEVSEMPHCWNPDAQKLIRPAR